MAMKLGHPAQERPILNLNDVQTEAHSTASSSAPPGKTARQVRPVRPCTAPAPRPLTARCRESPPVPPPELGRLGRLLPPARPSTTIARGLRNSLHCDSHIPQPKAPHPPHPLPNAASPVPEAMVTQRSTPRPHNTSGKPEHLDELRRTDSNTLNWHTKLDAQLEISGENRRQRE